MSVTNPDLKQGPAPHPGTGPDPEARDGEGNTRLHMLCSDIDVRAVDLQQALKAGCKVNAVDNWRETPLHTLVGASIGEAKMAECMSVLIKAGADVNARGYMGVTPLHLAVKTGRTDCIRDLLQAQADINVQDECGKTPLYDAVMCRNTDVLTLLLEHGADVNVRNEYGRTVLQKAESEENFACVQVLRQYGAEVDETAEASAPVDDVTTKRGAGADDSHETKPEPETESVSSAVKPTEKNPWSNPNTRDSKGRTPLHELCFSYNATANDLRQALEAGADVNAVDNWGNTPLHNLVSGASDNKAELIGVLIEAGVKVDAANWINKTALFVAVEREDTDSILALLRPPASAGAGSAQAGAGADINARDWRGETPLHSATSTRNTDLLRLLLEHGAAVNARNRWFETPLRLAQTHNNAACARVLREYGAYAGIAGQLAMAIQRIITKGKALIPFRSFGHWRNN